MKKRAYFKPKMVRVKLNPEQAVLSQCSAGASTLSDIDEAGFCKGSGGGCRQQTKSGGTNSTASS